MEQVETYRGQIARQALGQVLMHEHVFTVQPELTINYPSLIDWDERTAVDDAVVRLDELHRNGIGTIVDLTVLGIGRRPDLVSQVAARTSLNIVAATGVYVLDELPHYLQMRGPDGVFKEDEPMVALFERDIVEGITGCGARAAILKCATDRAGVTPGVERVLRAVARVHHRTGVPITTHTHARKRTGLGQLEVFRSEGVDLTNVVIGHSGDTDDLDYLQQLIDAGAYLGMDRFGLTPFLSTQRRVATVAALCRKGYASRMVLSHDAMCHNDSGRPAQRSAAFPDHHYLHISREVIPMLRDAGVTDADLEQMLVTNPAAILCRR